MMPRRSSTIPKIELRPEDTSDRALLFATYTSTRAEEMRLFPWSDEQKVEFLRMQFEAQSAHYDRQFPDAHCSVVEIDGRPAGRFYVDESADEIRIVDLALLPEFQARGIGTRLLEDVLKRAETSGKVVRLHVERSNPAFRLYDRMGFRMIDEAGPYLLLEHRPSAAK